MPYVRSSDGVRLHYTETGRRHGPPVLMIQGLGADKHLWNVQRLAMASSFRTIAMDNRGAGRSDKPYGAYSMEQMADDAAAVLDHAGVDTAHVVGASMGGVITQLLALRHEERIRSLTLACTACRHHQWRRELLAEWAEIAETRGMGAMTKEAARWMIGPRSFRRISPAVGWMGPLALSRPPHAFAGQVAGILAIDDHVRDRLHQVDKPTMVMVGNQDILTPRGDAEEIAELVPTAELVVISGAAHGFMIEHGTTFNRVLLDFLHRAEAAHRLSVDEAADHELTG
ncbi:MAG: alpha/beta fold hydrolase [Ilumatobacter sp.]|uniref:alpha/beta fold hydrolase n=1 Tax=Ilumatobacter sp. TaxID=1967498 RepID=UPI0026157E0B|nr:alpha/beta fold hydrolase [Ilumatobacter sp.]MDJ0767411.1 alpha/beta fold hydrolase [Ilumatobacter sp.]